MVHHHVPFRHASIWGITTFSDRHNHVNVVAKNDLNGKTLGGWALQKLDGWVLPVHDLLTHVKLELLRMCHQSQLQNNK